MRAQGGVEVRRYSFTSALDSDELLTSLLDHKHISGTHCTGPVRTGAENLALIVIRSPDRPAGSVVAIPTELSR
jgi:hypothetical protein